MNPRTGWMRALPFFAAGAFGLAFMVQVSAQVQKSQEEKVAGAATKKFSVERAEVVSVEGNDVFVKMEDGSIRHIANVSDSAHVTVDGKELGVHELKPGMHLQKTVMTTSTPKVIVTTQTVTGKVWHVNPPNSVILRMDNGENQQFKIPKGQMFTVNGKETDAFGLKKGMMVSATKVVEEPMTHVQQEAKLSGHMPPPPPPPAADVPILVAVGEPTAEVAAAAAPAELPKTGSNVPLIGLLGLLMIAASLGVRMFRKAQQ